MARSRKTAETVDFSDRNQGRNWFNGQPREVSVALAARAALRVLPLIGRSRDEAGFTAGACLPVFRAVTVAWATAEHPAHAGLLADAAEAAAEAVYAASRYTPRRALAAAAAAYYAARAARAPRAGSGRTDAEAADAAASVTSAIAQATVTEGAALYAAHDAALTKDALLIEGGPNRTDGAIRAVQAATAPLWSGAPPFAVASEWPELRFLLLAQKEDWEVWIDWYEDRLAGRPSIGEAFDIDLATLPDALWKEGPKAVNARIKELIAQHTQPEPIPAQGVGPHFGFSPEYRIALGPLPDLDPAGNHVSLLRQQLPLVREVADDLSARLNRNEFPELARNLATYRISIEGEPETIAWGVVFSRGVRLDNAAAAARRKISDRLQPALEDAAQEALTSLLTLHGPMILATAEGRALMADADRMNLTREQQTAFRQDAIAVATALNEDSEIIEQPAAEVVVEAVETIGQAPHPERGSAIGSATIRNVTIFTIGVGAIATLAGVGVLQAAAVVVAIEGLKKSKRFSALTDVLGGRIDGILRTGDAFQNFVIKNEQPLRQMAANSAGMRWMLPT